jgi:hypothetical protein
MRRTLLTSALNAAWSRVIPGNLVSPPSGSTARITQVA